ncbi:MAG: hypothetical protein ABJE95_19635 [Byssovorax sp.]
MATPEKFAGSNVVEILAALTTAMGVQNSIGTEESARNGAPGEGRVTWVPVPKGGRSYSQTSQQHAAYKHVHEVAVRFTVHLHARDYGAAERLEIAFSKALYDTFSPNAYEILGDGEQFGDVPGVTGYVFALPVRLLKIPLPVEIRKTITLTSASATGSLERIDGTGTTSTGTITAP